MIYEQFAGVLLMRLDMQCLSMKQKSPDAETKAKFDFITQGVLLIQCIMEVEAGIMLRNGEK